MLLRCAVNTWNQLLRKSTAKKTCQWAKVTFILNGLAVFFPTFIHHLLFATPTERPYAGFPCKTGWVVSNRKLKYFLTLLAYRCFFHSHHHHLLFNLCVLLSYFKVYFPQQIQTPENKSASCTCLYCLLWNLT